MSNGSTLDAPDPTRRLGCDLRARQSLVGMRCWYLCESERQWTLLKVSYNEQNVKVGNQNDIPDEGVSWNLHLFRTMQTERCCTMPSIFRMFLIQLTSHRVFCLSSYWMDVWKTPYLFFLSCSLNDFVCIDWTQWFFPLVALPGHTTCKVGQFYYSEVALL